MSRKAWATWTLFSLVFAVSLAGCKQAQDASPDPVYAETTVLETGSVVRITISDAPMTVPNLERHPHTYVGGKITIYSNDLVVFVDRDGIKHAQPLDWCSEIVYK